jgi:endonuclease/exonuclease/phosphatase family metal-dependent hydrolase
VHRLILLLALLFPLQTQARDLKIATWNLNWLTTRSTGDHDLPRDVKTRVPEDFAKLAEYARRLDADVIAIQEVDGFQAALKLFPKDRYSIHMTHDHVIQRVGIVVRRGLHYEVNPDVTELDGHHLRSGADITLHLGDTDLRILAVHLKKGCRNDPLPTATSRACEELKEQLPIVTNWITARRDEGEPFIVLGDFNRWMDGRDTFAPTMIQAAPMIRVTSGHSSPCWGNEHFIDHIFLGGAAQRWLQPQTLKVLVYDETDKSWQDRLSDHCPVSIRITAPDTDQEPSALSEAPQSR